MKKCKNFVVGSLLLMGTVLLSGCTPADIQYCRGFNVEGTPEFGKCIDYYHTQDAAFRSDLAVCNIEADGTYPPYLYDYGHDEHYVGGYDAFGRWHGGGFISVPPDYYHNRQVDGLRMRIIEPCMQEKGWNSGTSWQAGRRAVSKKKVVAPTKMPWQ